MIPSEREVRVRYLERRVARKRRELEQLDDKARALKQAVQSVRQSGQAQVTAHLTVTVRNTRCLLMPGATVQLKDALGNVVDSGITDAGGQVVFTVAGTATWTVVATKGDRTQTKSILVTAPTDRTLAMGLWPPTLLLTDNAYGNTVTFSASEPTPGFVHYTPDDCGQILATVTSQPDPTPNGGCGGDGQGTQLGQLTVYYYFTGNCAQDLRVRFACCEGIALLPPDFTQGGLTTYPIADRTCAETQVGCLQSAIDVASIADEPYAATWTVTSRAQPSHPWDVGNTFTISEPIGPMAAPAPGPLGELPRGAAPTRGPAPAPSIAPDPPAKGPIVPGTMATILGCDYRVLRYPDEDVDGCQCQARCLRGKGWPDGIVTLATCLECVR